MSIHSIFWNSLWIFMPKIIKYNSKLKLIQTQLTFWCYIFYWIVKSMFKKMKFHFLKCKSVRIKSGIFVVVVVEKCYRIICLLILKTKLITCTVFALYFLVTWLEFKFITNVFKTEYLKFDNSMWKFVCIGRNFSSFFLLAIKIIKIFHMKIIIRECFAISNVILWNWPEAIGCLCGLLFFFDNFFGWQWILFHGFGML